MNSHSLDEVLRICYQLVICQDALIIDENGNELFVTKTFCLTFPSVVLHGFICVINKKSLFMWRDRV